VIFGLLGPNGAGKTTLVKLLLGITFPTAGSATIIEKDISDYKIKEKVGYLPENHKYPSYLKGGEVLKFFGKLSGMNGVNLDKRIDELLELVKLSQWKKTKVKAYSKGMMQRLGLAQALINDPDLIFLDEPTDGVDPIGRKEIRDILGLKPGELLKVEHSDDEVILKPFREEPPIKVKDGVLIYAGTATGNLMEAVRAHREERVRRVSSPRRS